MKLSFLIQLFLLLLLVISIFLVFTNSVTGRIKLIMIVFCIVLGLYLYSKLNILKDYNEFISTPISAKEGAEIPNKTLKQSEGEFTMSTWIFIDDWNYRYGKEKTIISKELPSRSGITHLPTISLDAYKNDLIVRIDTFGEDQTSYKDLVKGHLVEKKGINGDAFDVSVSNVKCESGKIVVEDSDGDELLKLDDLSGGEVTITDISCTDVIGSSQEIRVENIYLQKWVNVIVTLSTRSVDVYINGKLVKTKTMNNAIDTLALNYGDIKITPDGGFGGYISKVRYYPDYISPKKAWEIYKDGFGDAFESSLNKYNMSLTFYKDAIAQNKFYLF